MKGILYTIRRYLNLPETVFKVLPITSQDGVMFAGEALFFLPRDLAALDSLLRTSGCKVYLLADEKYIEKCSHLLPSGVIYTTHSSWSLLTQEYAKHISL